MIEVMVATMILSIAVLSALSNQPQAWIAAGRTDYLGRAAGILQSELERNEILIMNPNRAVGTGDATATVSTSGQNPPLQGDITYTVRTVVASAGTAIWRVTVTVTWPGSTGITGSILVTRQEPFRS